MWPQRWGGLRWVDMLAGDILTLSASGVGRRHVGRIAAALRPRLQGGAVIGVERGFALEDADGTLTYLDPLWVTGRLRMNEGACDPDGRFYGGSMGHYHQRGAEALYRHDPDCSARMVLDHTIFNGLDWSRDGARAFYTDTETHRVDVFDYERATGLTGRRRSSRSPPTSAVPAGAPSTRRVASGSLSTGRRGAPLHRRRRPRSGVRGVGPEGHSLHLRRHTPGRAVHHDVPGGS